MDQDKAINVRLRKTIWKRQRPIQTNTPSVPAPRLWLASTTKPNEYELPARMQGSEGAAACRAAACHVRNIES